MATTPEQYTVSDGGKLISSMLSTANEHRQEAPANGADFAADLRDIYNAMETFETNAGQFLDPVLQGQAIDRYASLLEAYFAPATNGNGRNNNNNDTPEQRADRFFDGVNDIALNIISSIDKQEETASRTSTLNNAITSFEPVDFGTRTTPRSEGNTNPFSGMLA